MPIPATAYLTVAWNFISSRFRSRNQGAVSTFENNEELDEADVECAVCLVKMEEEGEEIRKLRCDHAFHKICLDKWMEYGCKTCPLCRDSLAPKMCEDNNPYKCRTRREEEFGGWLWSENDDISFNF